MKTYQIIPIGTGFQVAEPVLGSGADEPIHFRTKAEARAWLLRVVSVLSAEEEAERRRDLGEGWFAPA
jgi:hypothetical protein